MNGTVVLVMLGQDVVLLAAIGAGLKLGLKVAEEIPPSCFSASPITSCLDTSHNCAVFLVTMRSQLLTG